MPKHDRTATPKGHCTHCGNALKPIGYARSKGKKHNDWRNRTLHKKCWKEIKKAEESEETNHDYARSHASARLYASIFS